MRKIEKEACCNAQASGITFLFPHDDLDHSEGKPGPVLILKNLGTRFGFSKVYKIAKLAHWKSPNFFLFAHFRPQNLKNEKPGHPGFETEKPDLFK